MNPPLPLTRPDADADEHLDLDTRIQRVEQRLIARQDRLHHGIAGLARQARRQLRPRRLLAPVGGAVLAALALRSLWLSPKVPTPAAASSTGPAPDGAPNLFREVPWVRLIGLAWPLLPAQWRDRVSPAAASSFFTLGLPLVERLISGRRPTPVQTVPEADLMRLSGRWFLVGELPASLAADPVEPPEMGLLPRDDGQFDLLQRRIDRRGTHGTEALLQPVPGSRGTRFRVSHWPQALQWLSWAWSDLALLHVDAGYEEALIGSPERDTLWLLSRTPNLAPERRQALALIARDRGFDVGKLHFASSP
jgi:apolipoprotein D and lipocalin family protein